MKQKCSNLGRLINEEEVGRAYQMGKSSSGHLLSEKEINFLKKHCDQISYSKDEVLIYEDHVPKVGIVLLSGKLAQIKWNDVKLLPPFSSIGIRELYNNLSMDCSVKIFKGADILVLSKSKIEDLKNDQSLKLCFLKQFYAKVEL